jgi:hypothetical protein
MNKKIIYIIIVLLFSIFQPIFGISILFIYVFHKLIKNKLQLKRKRYQLKDIIVNFISKDNKEIYLESNIQIYKAKDGFRVIKNGFYWTIIFRLKVNFKFYNNIDLKNISELMHKLNSNLIINDSSSCLIEIKENIYGYRLSKKLFNTKTYTLLGKAQYLISYFESLNCSVEIYDEIAKEVYLNF